MPVQTTMYVKPAKRLLADTEFTGRMWLAYESAQKTEERLKLTRWTRGFKGQMVFSTWVQKEKLKDQSKRPKQRLGGQRCEWRW